MINKYGLWSLNTNAPLLLWGRRKKPCCESGYRHGSRSCSCSFSSTRAQHHQFYQCHKGSIKGGDMGPTITILPCFMQAQPIASPRQVKLHLLTSWRRTQFRAEGNVARRITLV